ncbi:alpha/beta fold hydrolase [Amycolatopsis sp. 195334CR]|uniref:alpha/beta fold hydrolase n=1 Tax=Amycolatopsis sp. 195334CR TaxID=2814588 RepID=UPI0027DD486D|nr:alpha/beta fold hydrolase [Amycolatopsis sp. 195334CR]
MPPTTPNGRTPITHVPLSTTPLPSLDPHVAPWPGKTEEIGGIGLHLRRTPGADGALAVYVHGLGGSSTNWTELSALLAPFATGIAVDLPGFGFSEPPAEFDFGLNSHAALLAEFLDGLGKGPVHLLGNSMGGAIALLVAARRPELVRTLTLISPAMPDRRVDHRRLSDPRMALAYLPFVGKRVRHALASLGPEERAKQVIKLCFADPAAFPERRLAELAEEHSARAEFAWAAPAMAKSTFGIFRAWFSRGPASLWAAAAEVTAPTLVIWGEKDRVISVRRASRTATLVPRARLFVLPRTGHVAQMERPNAVAKAVLGMWERVEADRW